MKKNISASFMALGLMVGVSTSLYAVDYTWTGTTDDNFAVSTNWDPERTAPAATDVLIFDQSATVTNIQTQTIEGLTVTGNAAVIFEAAGTVTLSIDGGADAFGIDAGSSLRLRGSNPIEISLINGSTGSIGGDVIFNATANAILQRINADTAGALRILDGGTTAMAPTGTGASGGFSGSATGAIVFESGSAHHQAAEKDGTRNGGTGLNPFSTAASVVVFEPGSTYVLWNGFANLSNRSFGTFISRASAGGTLGTVTGTNTFSDDLRLEPSGEVAQGSWGTNSANAGDLLVVEGDLYIDPNGPELNMFASPGSPQYFRVRGDVTIGAPDKFNIDGSIQRFFALDGTTQNFDPNGTSVRNLIIDSDVTIVSPLSILNSVTIESGASLTATGDGRLLVADGVVVPAAYTGPLGAAERMNATNLGTTNLVLAEAPVSFEITTAGSGVTGVLSAFTETGTPANSTGLKAIERTWTIDFIRASGYTGTLSLTYEESDLLVGADESALVAARWTGSEWELLEATSTVDVPNRTVTITGVTEFSQWTLVDTSPDPTPTVTPTPSPTPEPTPTPTPTVTPTPTPEPTPTPDPGTVITVGPGGDFATLSAAVASLAGTKSSHTTIEITAHTTDTAVVDLAAVTGDVTVTGNVGGDSAIINYDGTGTYILISQSNSEQQIVLENLVLLPLHDPAIVNKDARPFTVSGNTETTSNLIALSNVLITAANADQSAADPEAALPSTAAADITRWGPADIFLGSNQPGSTTVYDLNDVTIAHYGNTTGNVGGLTVFADAGTLNITNSAFLRNGRMGVQFDTVVAGLEVNITNSRFNNNVAAGLNTIATDTDLVINVGPGSEFNNNGNHGFAIRGEGTHVTVEGTASDPVLFQNNGGAGTVWRGFFFWSQGNTSTLPLVDHVIITGNVSGGLDITQMAAGATTISNSIIAENNVNGPANAGDLVITTATASPTTVTLSGVTLFDNKGPAGQRHAIRSSNTPTQLTIEASDVIIAGAGVDVNLGSGTTLNIEDSAIVESGPHAVASPAVVGSGSFSATNVISADPLFVSTDVNDASYLDVDSQNYGNAGPGGGPLSGGANYIGATSVSDWMILMD